MPSPSNQASIPIAENSSLNLAIVPAELMQDESVWNPLNRSREGRPPRNRRPNLQRMLIDKKPTSYRNQLKNLDPAFNIPEKFQDPVHFELMNKPKILQCGHTFDEVTLKELKRLKDLRCPCCRESIHPFFITNSIPNLVMMREIEEFLILQKDMTSFSNCMSLDILIGAPLYGALSANLGSLLNYLVFGLPTDNDAYFPFLTADAVAHLAFGATYVVLDRIKKTRHLMYNNPVSTGTLFATIPTTLALIPYLPFYSSIAAPLGGYVVNTSLALLFIAGRCIKNISNPAEVSRDTKFSDQEKINLLATSSPASSHRNRIARLPVKSKPPGIYLDPLHKELMNDPQILQCGHTIDKITLEHLAAKQDKNCPCCRVVIQDYFITKPITNYYLKNRIDTFVSSAEKLSQRNQSSFISNAFSFFSGRRNNIDTRAAVEVSRLDEPLVGIRLG